MVDRASVGGGGVGQSIAVNRRQEIGIRPDTRLDRGRYRLLVFVPIEAGEVDGFTWRHGAI